MRSSSHALVAPDRAISSAVMNCALGLSGGGLDERKYAQPLRASALRASEEAAILERRKSNLPLWGENSLIRKNSAVLANAPHHVLPGFRSTVPVPVGRQPLADARSPMPVRRCPFADARCPFRPDLRIVPGGVLAGPAAARAEPCLHRVRSPVRQRTPFPFCHGRHDQ